jgi:outer membrane protein OmpA-like peptidoglycan-associated protein
MNLLQKMKGDAQPLPPHPPKKSVILAGLGGIIAISLLGLLGATTQTMLVLGSFGASCVLLFGFPDTPFSQPRNVVAGHFLSSLIGLAFLNALGPSWWAMGLAAGTAISVMMATRTVHPPAGSNPVIVFLSQPGWGFLLFPTLIGAAVLVLVGLFFLNATREARYPKYWLGGAFEPLRLATLRPIYVPLTAGILVSAAVAGGVMWRFDLDPTSRTDLSKQAALPAVTVALANAPLEPDPARARESNATPLEEIGPEVAARRENTSSMVSVVAGKDDLLEKKLPSGVELRISRLSAENRLLEFLESKTTSPTRTGRFDLDQLSFGTARESLQPSSQGQLRNVAEILKAYPTVKAKVGASPDSVGEKTFNSRLTQRRANGVVRELVRMGVDRSRISARLDHSTTTKALNGGTVQNDRISLSVTD